jgi:acyl carrier protein
MRFWRAPDAPPTAASTPTSSSRADADVAAASSTGPDTAIGGLEARVRYLVADIGGYAVEEIDLDALLGDDLGYDSPLQLRLIDRIRTEYPQLQDAPVDELVLAIRNVDDVVRYVADRISEVA